MSLIFLRLKKTQRNIVGYKLAYLRLNVRAKRLGRKITFNGDNFANICVAVLSIISLNTMKNDIVNLIKKYLLFLSIFDRPKL